MQASLAKKMIFLSAIVLLNLLALEIAARVYKAITRGPEPVVPPQIGRFDPELGWALIPNAVGHSERTGYVIEYRTNSAGLRDDDTPVRKPAGTYRIVLVGDSRTFGFGVPIEKHFSKLLEGYFDRVEVINLGVSGYGVDQELLTLRKNGLQYEPDLVMAYVAHYGDHRHMHADRFGKRKPQFHLTPQGLVLENTLEAQPEGAERSDQGDGIDGTLSSYSTLYRIVSGRIGRLTGAQQEDAVAVYRRQKEQDEADLQNPAFVRRMNELGVAIVAEMLREASGVGADFLLVTQVDELHRAAQESGIPSLDVSPSLDNPAYSLPEDLAHINESGNGALAWEIARHLRAQGLVPSTNLR